MNYQCEVCHVFETVLEELEETFCEFYPPDVQHAVCDAIEQLEGTFDPLLDGYYGLLYCKEVYCNVRDFRDTAVTYLHCAKKVLAQFDPEDCSRVPFASRLSEKEFGDTNDYIREAICWIEKARLCLCFVVVDCEDGDCEDDCDSDSCESDSCDSDSCDSDSCDSDSCDSDSCDSSDDCC